MKTRPRNEMSVGAGGGGRNGPSQARTWSRFLAVF